MKWDIIPAAIEINTKKEKSFFKRGWKLSTGKADIKSEGEKLMGKPFKEGVSSNLLKECFNRKIVHYVHY